MNFRTFAAASVVLSIFAVAAADAKPFNKPTCGWWQPDWHTKLVFLGECVPLVTIQLADGTIITVPGISIPGGGPGDKPGHGYGDGNHSHSGPPGQNK